MRLCGRLSGRTGSDHWSMVDVPGWSDSARRPGAEAHTEARCCRPSPRVLRAVPRLSVVQRDEAHGVRPARTIDWPGSPGDRACHRAGVTPRHPRAAPTARDVPGSRARNRGSRSGLRRSTCHCAARCGARVHNQDRRIRWLAPPARQPRIVAPLLLPRVSCRSCRTPSRRAVAVATAVVSRLGAGPAGAGMAAVCRQLARPYGHGDAGSN